MRWLVHFCLVLLLMTVQGGGATLADSVLIGERMAVTEYGMAASLPATALAEAAKSGTLEACCETVGEIAPSRQASAPCSPDCFGPLPLAVSTLGPPAPSRLDHHRPAMRSSKDQRHLRPPRA